MEQDTNTTSTAAQTSALPGRAKADDKGSSSVTWGITIISAVSLSLTLLGYGVALAVEATFGIPHETVYSSVLDLIGLSVYAVNSVVLKLGEISWWPILGRAWQSSVIAAVGMFIFVCCLVYLRTRQSRTRGRTHRFWRYLKPPMEQDSTRQLLGKGAIGSGLFGGLVFISPFLIANVIMAIVVMLSIIPIVGVQLGQHYLRQYVVAPTACVPVVSRNAMMQAWSSPPKKDAPTLPAATCVKLLKDETPIASGRVVVSTSTAIVLFEPDSDRYGACQ